MRSILFLLSLLMLAACDDPASRSAQKELPQLSSGRLDISHRGEAAPKTRFTAPDGLPVTLEEFRGKPVLVNLWATWCPPCISEMPMLDRVAEREGEKLSLITVSQDSEGRKAVDPFFARSGFKRLQPFVDETSALGIAAKSDLLPTTIFYDSAGREQWRVTGALDWTNDEATRLLRASLDE